MLEYLLAYLHAGMPECLLASGTFECVFAYLLAGMVVCALA